MSVRTQFKVSDCFHVMNVGVPRTPSEERTGATKHLGEEILSLRSGSESLLEGERVASTERRKGNDPNALDEPRLPHPPESTRSQRAAKCSRKLRPIILSTLESMEIGLGLVNPEPG